MVELSVPVTEQDFSLGLVDAPITLLEYGDYDCQHCQQAYAIVEGLRSTLGDRLRFVYRPFPRETRDSPGTRAAEAALAAGAQGRFWEMHGLLLSPNTSLDLTNLLDLPISYREILSLDEDRFAQDLTSNRYLGRVKEYVHSGVDSGVRSTPTFFINGRRHDDFWDRETLLDAIEQSADIFA